MADLRIVDAPLLSTVKGTEKIPTGGEGNFSISVNQVADFAKLKWVLATEEYVVNAVGNVQADLNLHKNNSSNPHQVTKLQVGLGNVDNTADLDKPVSNATQSAIITANSSKADISYVDTAVGAISTDGSKQYATLALANADIANIALNKNVFVSDAANGGYWYKATAEATSLTKSPYDPLTQAKAYTDKNGYATVVATNSLNINYTTSNKILSFTGAAYVFSDTARYQLATPQNLVVDTNGTYRIDYDIDTGNLIVKPFSLARTEGSLIVGFLVVSADGIRTNDFRFAINGVLYDPINDAKDYVSKTGYGSVVGTSLANINYTTADRNLNFKDTVYVFSGTTRYQLTTPQSVNLPNNTVYRLEFNTTTGLIEARPYTQDRTLGNIVIGFVSTSDSGLKTKDFGFTINGLALEQPKIATLHGDAKAISIDSTTGMLKLASIRVITDNALTDVVTQDVDFSSAKTAVSTHYLFYNTVTKAFQFSSSITNLQTQDALKMVATFIPSTGEIRGLSQPYTRNGQVIGGAASTNTGIVLSIAEGLNFNFTAQKIEVTVEIQVLHNGFRFKLPIQEVDISSYASSLWFALVADLKTGLIQILPTNAMYSRDLVILGALRKDIKAVANIDNYSIDGVSKNNSGTVTPVQPTITKLPSLGWDLSGVYTAPTLVGYRSSGADPLRAIDVTSDIINGWFDGLVTENPSYIKKTHLGDEYTGLPINEYRFKPDMGGSTTPIKVLIHGGTHGEPMSYLLPYHVMNLIANHWQESPLLEALHFGVEFSVIPAVNAWGITNGNARYNSRDVNLNRNYPVDWVATGDKPGVSALSELETQFAYANMTAFKPHVALDMHSFGTRATGDFMWMTVESSPEAITVGSSMINRMRQKWVKETPDILLASALDRNGDATSMGSTVRTMKGVGAISLTFEVGTKIIGEQPLAEHYSELSVRYGVEALINYLIILLRRNA